MEAITRHAVYTAQDRLQKGDLHTTFVMFHSSTKFELLVAMAPLFIRKLLHTRYRC